VSVPASEFAWPTRVYYEDTDSGGVVYYANYLKFMERARTEWLRHRGFSQQQLVEAHGFVFAVVEIEVKYKKPARLDDELLVSCVPQPEGRASMRFIQRVTRAKPGEAPELMAEGNVRVVCVDAKDFRPRALPEFVRGI
jgi:acyl-CoA thioester hydrolase